MIGRIGSGKTVMMGSFLGVLFLFPSFGSVICPPEIWSVGVTYPNGVGQRNFIGVQVKASEDTVVVQYWLIYPNGTRYSDGEGVFMNKWKYRASGVNGITSGPAGHRRKKDCGR